MRVTYAARSHRGYCRDSNEDNLFACGFTLPPGGEERPFSLDGVSAGPLVLAVCDGMGGEENGALASRAAAHALKDYSPALCAAGPDAYARLVDQYLDQVRQTIQAQNPGKRTGTTLALAIVSKKGLYCYNLGDSRIYLLKGDVLRQVTHDHTLGAQRRLRGDCSGLPSGGPDHALTRCLGIGKAQPPEAYPPIRGSCRLLICSDGLTKMVDDPAIRQVLCQCPTASEAADRLMALALGQGGRDNVTAVVADLKTGLRALSRA